MSAEKPELLNFPDGYNAAKFNGNQNLSQSLSFFDNALVDLEILGVPTSFTTVGLTKCFTKPVRDSIVIELDRNATGNVTTASAELATCRSEGVPDWFYFRMTFFDSEVAFTTRILEALKHREHILFYFWTPHTLPVTFDVVRVARSAASTPLLMIWRE